MTRKILSIIALFVSLCWILVLYKGLPAAIYDPDGTLAVIVLVVSDLLLLLIGSILTVSALKRKASCWIALTVLAIPAMHALGSILESPFNLVFFFFPIGVLPVIMLVKWNSMGS